MDRWGTNLPMSGQSYRRVEVLTGTERRRRWTSDEKARIVSESFGPNVVVSHVARRYGLHPNQLYAWRRELADAAARDTSPDFVPISVGTPDCSASIAVEICLSGAVVRAVPGVELGFLADVLRVVTALA